MSLQVWLPLNGDLRNQGLNNMTFSNTNTTNIVEDSNGKLGKCYKRTTKQTAGRIISNTTINLSADFSMCCWAKVTDCISSANGLVSNHSHADNTGFGITVREMSTTDYRISCNTGSGSDRTYNTYYGTSNIKDAWHHLAITYDKDNTQLKLWVDGICENTIIYNGVSKADYIILFDWSTTYDSYQYRPAVAMNDVRIYDHALSPLEVKHLAQGLVLHYPLNRGGFGQDNLVNGLYAAGRTIVNNGIVTALLSQNLDCYFHFTCSEDLLAENDYTISMDVSGFSGADKYLVWGIISQNSGQTITMRNGKCFAIFSPSSNITAGTKIIIDDINRTSSGLTDLTIRNIKVEHGSIPTPWIPNQADALYSQMGLDNNIEYDVSGYGNNGEMYTIDSTGYFQYVTGSSRYSVATNIHSGTSTVHQKAGTAYIRGNLALTTPNQLTIAFWCYARNEGYQGSCGQGMFCTTNKTGDDTATDYYNATAMNHYDNRVTVSKASKDGNIKLGITFLPDSWHHYAFTYDGQYARSYRDGILQNTAYFSTATALASVSSVIIGFSRAGGVWRKNNNDYSDFRIYATALSADDVMALYKNAGYVDSDGNVYAYEMTE